VNIFRIYTSSPVSYSGTSSSHGIRCKFHT